MPERRPVRPEPRVRRLAVLTSGGDAPGMNAAIRAVTRLGRDRGLEVLGVSGGFAGLVAGDFVPLGRRDVGGIVQRGGTVLGTGRYRAFADEAVQRRAVAALRAARVDALVVVGGNGSQAGAHALHGLGFGVVGIASTIDNDLLGTETTIGFATAVETVVAAIDRLRDTATSHRRIFLVEVMGRASGFIALHAALAGGAEICLIPERPVDVEAVMDALVSAYAVKDHAIVVVAEGARPALAELADAFARRAAGRGLGDVGIRTTVLGYVQRGGRPVAADRVLAARLARTAVEAVVEGRFGVLAGIVGGRPALTPLADVVGGIKPPPDDLPGLAEALAE